jgi:hypothetical protein
LSRTSAALTEEIPKGAISRTLDDADGVDKPSTPPGVLEA